MIEARPGDLLGDGRAHEEVAPEIEREVGAGEDVGIGLAGFDRLDVLSGGRGGIPVVRRGRLVHILDLRPHIAAEAAGAEITVDIALQERSGDFLLHAPGLGDEKARREIGDIGVVGGGDRGRDVPREDGRNAPESEFGAGQEHPARQGLEGGYRQGSFGLLLVFGPVAVVEAELDLAENCIEGPRRHEAVGVELILYFRERPVAGPERRGPDLDPGRVGIVERERQGREGAGVEIVDGRIVDRLARRILILGKVGGIALGAVGFGVAQVAGDFPFSLAKLILPTERGELVHAIVVEGADDRVDVGDRAADETVVDDGRGRVGEARVERGVGHADRDLQPIGGLLAAEF